MLLDLLCSIYDMFWIVIPYDQHTRVPDESGKVMLLTSRKK